eukprot:s7_g4.t1
MQHPGGSDQDESESDQDGDDYDAPQTEGSKTATTSSQTKGRNVGGLASFLTSVCAKKSTTKSTTPPSGGAAATTTAATTMATTTAAAATTTKGAGGSGNAKTTEKPTTTKKTEKDEDEAEDWDTPRSTSAVSTTTTTTLFCHCYVNVTWRSEAHGMAPTGPLGQQKLRRATVPHSISGKLGGGAADFFLGPTEPHEEDETVIGSWSVPEANFHGYSDDKAPLDCHNAHRHSPYSTILPLDVRPDDSFYISKACETNNNVVLCSNAWLIFDFEERFTLTKLRLWNYATDEAVRKILVSAGQDLESLQEAQVFHELSKADAPKPPADLSMRGKVPSSPHPVTEMTLDVPLTGRFLKIEILQNYGAQGVGFYRAAFDGFKSPFTDYMPFPGKSCGGYELEDLNGNFTLPELFCRALCSSRMDCAAFEVVYSGEHAGRCIFHSNIWIPTKALDDDRDCYVKDNQARPEKHMHCQQITPLTCAAAQNVAFAVVTNALGVLEDVSVVVLELFGPCGICAPTTQMLGLCFVPSLAAVAIRAAPPVSNAMALRRLLLAAATGAAAKFASWESHGELMDEEALKQKATSQERFLELIDAVNSASDKTWVAGENLRFSGATLAEAKILMGTLQDMSNLTRLPYKPLDKVVDLPAEFDWRTDARAKNCPSLKEIRDQADCGSCWAFGSVEAMTDRICIASKGQKQIHLSAEDVTSCDTLGDMGCNGGIPSTVYTYYKTFGIVDGGNYGDKSMCYSYQLKPCAHHSSSAKYPNCTSSEATPKCARKCVDNGANWRSSKHYGTGGYSVCQQGDSKCSDAMMQEIYQNGPITGMFFVHQSFLSYKSGVYKAGFFFKDPMLGGHAIKIMGWGTENGSPYWLVANSWNEDWGDHGYFKIERGTNQCQIENPIVNGGPVAGLPKTSGNESDIIPKGLEVSKFQASALSRAGGTAADLTGVNTGIEIKGYQEWFPRTSTFMCWIKPTFQRDQTWYFVFRSSGYAMHDPEDTKNWRDDETAQVCLPPIDTTGYVILEGSASRVSFQVEAKCDEANGFGGRAKVLACSSSTKRYVLSGCLRKEQCPLRMLRQAASGCAFTKRSILPLALLLVALRQLTFVPAPSNAPRVQPQLRAAEVAAVSAGLSMVNAAPALATWGEGSEPGQNIDPDSTEYYNRKAVRVERHGHLPHLCGLPLWPGRQPGTKACGEQVAELSQLTFTVQLFD